jgi:hypothetical protein
VKVTTVFGVGGRRHRRWRRRVERPRPTRPRRPAPPPPAALFRAVAFLGTGPSLDRLMRAHARYEAQLRTLAVRAQRRVAFARGAPR